MAQPAFCCERVRIELPGANGTLRLIDGLDLEIDRGDFVSVLGGSGTGKTTLLRVLGGLTAYSAGIVRYEGEVVSGPPPGTGIVFQDYGHALLTWRTVRRNVSLGIEARMPEAEVARRVGKALQMVDLEQSRDEYPWRLSGGMQQRVQIARSLAMEPSALLMDEPFGALDAMSKAALQDQLLTVQRETAATILFVTHDIEEAIYLSDRIIVLNGRPARIRLDLKIDLPRPRNQVLTKELPEYLRLRHSLYEAFKDELHG
ncbi:ABC transporter ATP-binding protein [Mesorhizobium camelthorni]|uniref:ABC transporter ATP-binding protein n=2 Tax=Allomesorhizobium camelthorni TaxID=475069 RepID=A0A6G4WFS9_9HYPH|nr:ABC transporter ATP-binding protein [Mesorhizobium camelthorni]